MEEQLNVIKDKFRLFLVNKSLKETTVKQYIVWMARIEKWFIENTIVEKNFNIWQDKAQIEKIQSHLEDEANSGWKTANKPIKNWMSAPWNAWVDFNNNVHVVKDEEIESKKLDADLLEKFADWVIERDGKSHNYFSDSFGSKKSNLVNQLSKYDDIYKKQFGNSIFNLANQDISEFISKLDENLYLTTGNFYEYSLKISSHMPRAILGRNNYIKFLKEVEAKQTIAEKDFDYKSFHKKAEYAGLVFSERMTNRFIASLCTKPFVILTGLSGSGKTKLAQAFVQWICESDSQYKIVPVGADWTNREPLLGYPNGLIKEEYITPDSGVLHLLLKATTEENRFKPHFIILDEMNLSHVERYFADFLSIMESKDTIKLYTGNDRKGLDGLHIPQQIGWPENVFIIGTVNIDETTYMFSPKVLDRANVIEFRITDDDMAKFLENPESPVLSKLIKQGVNMAESFLATAGTSEIFIDKDINGELNSFFRELKKVGAEFGYRSANEMLQLISKLKFLNPHIKNKDCLDLAIMQKLLPKLHGSRSKLASVLVALGEICLADKTNCKALYFDVESNGDFSIDKNLKFPISFEKLIRMYKNVVANGFTSYAEA